MTKRSFPPRPKEDKRLTPEIQPPKPIPVQKDLAPAEKYCALAARLHDEVWRQAEHALDRAKKFGFELEDLLPTHDPLELVLDPHGTVEIRFVLRFRARALTPPNDVIPGGPGDGAGGPEGDQQR